MPSKKVALSFFGGTGEVTGSNFLLEFVDEAKPIRILIDCGMFQGSKIGDEKNREPFVYDPSSIDYLLVTHAHIDHTGRIPKLVKDGFRGKIYSTSPTKDIAAVMLEDSLGVLEKEARDEGRATFYDSKDIVSALSKWQGVDYHEPLMLGENIKVRFWDAGHTLGSSVVYFTYNFKNVLVF